MKIVIFGLTITSAWGNGHATTFRSLVKALAGRKHDVVFVEKDVEWYRTNRDLPRPESCSLELYDHWKLHEARFMDLARDADAVVIGSYFPDAIEAIQALVAGAIGPLLFYDIDTPVTLRALREDGGLAYLDASMIPLFDAYLSLTGGPTLLELEQSFGAKRALAFYCSVDADFYKPSPSRREFSCDLSYLGTYAVDRQPKLIHFLNEPARRLPERRFIVAGAMYPRETEWASNVVRFAHVGPPDHPAFYSSARFSLNLTRTDMVLAGYSPSVRLFEASACGAAIISDTWPGLDGFLSPGTEILTPADGRELADVILHLSDLERRRIGSSARDRVLAQHTSVHRALQFENIIGSLGSKCAEQRAARTMQGKEPAPSSPTAAVYTRL